MLLSFWRTAGAVGQGLYKAGCDLCAIGARGVSDSFRSRQIKLSLNCLSAHTACGSTARSAHTTPNTPGRGATPNRGRTSKPCDTSRRVHSQANAYSTGRCLGALRAAHVHTHTHETWRKAIRHVSPSSTHGTLPPGRSQGLILRSTISLCLGIIRSWGASHPARIHIRFTSRFAQRLCEGLHRFPEAAAILEHIGHLRVPDRTLSVSRHVRFITLCGRTMHRDRIPTSQWQCPDPTPSPRHVRAPRP